MKKLSILVFLVSAGCGEPEKGDERSNPIEKTLNPVIDPQPEKKEERTKKEYGTACELDVPADIKDLIEKTRAVNQAARDVAVEAERKRLGVTPLKPSTIIGHGWRGQNEIKPETDPFPNSVVVAGDKSYDVRKLGYQLNHGKMDMETIYETSPGSGQFFIVDMISGDGVGGNGMEVSSYTVEYGLTNQSADLNGSSFHSWHVTADNLIIRATQEVQDDVLDEVTVCGCGNLEEVEDRSKSSSNDDMAKGAPASDLSVAATPIAIFMLPGNGLPKISTDVFKAGFKRSYVKQKFVPRPGFRCMNRIMEAC